MNKRDYIISIISLILIFLFIFLIINYSKEIDNKIENVCFEENCFKVELAITESERAKGLMFKETLEDNSGMLFIFPEEGVYNFWMKNTLIPLDIIWISKEEKVVHIEKNVQPCKENICRSYGPDRKVLYVLELNSGKIEEKGIKIGDKVSFS